MRQRLDRLNQQLTKESARLKTQLRAQEDDREFIVRQMLSLKKENSRLKGMVEAVGAACWMCFSHLEDVFLIRIRITRPGGNGGPRHSGALAFACALMSVARRKLTTPLESRSSNDSEDMNALPHAHSHPLHFMTGA